MTQRTKHVLIVLAVVAAFGVVGHMDAQDHQCSWNGCGDERFAETRE